MRQPVRTRAVVLAELAGKSADRDRAARAVDFESYERLSEEIGTLLAELSPLLPAQRVSDASR